MLETWLGELSLTATWVGGGYMSCLCRGFCVWFLFISSLISRSSHCDPCQAWPTPGGPPMESLMRLTVTLRLSILVLLTSSWSCVYFYSPSLQTHQMTLLLSTTVSLLTTRISRWYFVPLYILNIIFRFSLVRKVTSLSRRLIQR